MMPIAIIGVAIMIAVVFYIQTLCALSVSMMHCEGDATEISKTIYANSNSVSEVEERYDYCYVGKARVAAYMIQLYPELVNTAELAHLAEILDCQEIRVLDMNGCTVAASSGKDAYRISADPDSHSYP